MTTKLDFRVTQSSATDVARHLQRTDGAFVPPLRGRVDIATYAEKIAARAERLEFWADGRLVALVAAYVDKSGPGRLFVTNVSVLPEFQRQGLANALLDECIGLALARGLRRVSLEVDQTNAAALALYEDRGFRVVGSNGRTLSLSRDILPGSEPT